MDRPRRPDEEELREHLPQDLYASALRRCARRTSTTTSRGRGSSRTATYILGIFLLPVAVPDEDRVYYQEIDFVATRERLVSVSKTPPGETAVRPAAGEGSVPPRRPRRHVRRTTSSTNIAERYLDLVDDLDDEIDELEDMVARRARRRWSGDACASSATTCARSAGR